MIIALSTITSRTPAWMLLRNEVRHVQLCKYVSRLIFDPVAAAGKSCECYLGLLFAMEDVAVYGYITPLKVKIIAALALSDTVVKDAEITTVSLKLCAYLRKC